MVDNEEISDYLCLFCLYVSQTNLCVYVCALEVCGRLVGGVLVVLEKSKNC
jgi:hypothetical protein